MENVFPYSNSNKRYYTYDYYLKHKYGEKVFKVPLNAGFSCPNRDGKIGLNGCIFCSNGSGEFCCDKNVSLLTQFDNQLAILHKKWPTAKYIAYFQSNTNTYASIDYLKKCYEPFIGKEGVVGISIATRPDCLNDEILDYLSDVSKRTDLSIELGLQTIHDETALVINRGYKYATFLKAINDLRSRNINIIVHIINGLPGETKEMMIETAKTIGALPIDGIKFHSLLILKGTQIEKDYESGHIEVLSKDEYIDIVVEQLEYLNPRIVVHRICSDAGENGLIAPLWTIKKTIVSNDIDKLLAKRNSIQGKKYRLSYFYEHLHVDIDEQEKRKLCITLNLGDGYEGLFLSQYYEQVICFDTQDHAIKKSMKLLRHCHNVSIINDNYQYINNYLSKKIDLIFFNVCSSHNPRNIDILNNKSVMKIVADLLTHINTGGYFIIELTNDNESLVIKNSIIKYLIDNDINYVVLDIENLESLIKIKL